MIVSITDVSSEVEVITSVWRRLAAEGAYTAAAAGEEVVPASEHRALQQQVREWHRLLGKKTLVREPAPQEPFKHVWAE